MKLYSYFRSTAAYRVRIALELKGLERDDVFVRLPTGEQQSAEYLGLNPQGLVPVLQDGLHVITQSLAIVEYLDELYPRPPLLPRDPLGRARVRALSLVVACEIHPLQNLRVRQLLTREFGLSEDDARRWYRHWVERGLLDLEALLARDPATGRFCHGDRPGMADVFLIPQVYAAERFECDLERCPTVLRIHRACQRLEAFARAAPDAQPDARAPAF